MTSRILQGITALALLAQGALAWVLYRYLTGEPGPELIDPFRWGVAAMAVSAAAGVIAVIGGAVLHRRPGAALTIGLGAAAVAFSLFEGLFFGFIYLVGKGNPR